MKTLKLLSLLFIATLASCSSVYVNADYDKNATFSNYKTYAYMKNNLDNIAISDLDKKRILHSIDEVMATKGFSKSENPDVLISIFTKERERVDVYQNYENKASNLIFRATSWGFVDTHTKEIFKKRKRTQKNLQNMLITQEPEVFSGNAEKIARESIFK